MSETIEREDEREDLVDGREGQADIERRARAQGWIPEDEWDEERAKRDGKKKPLRFVSAEEYLERIENSAPMMRAENRRLSEQVGSLQTRIDDLTKLVGNMHRSTSVLTKQAYERGMAEAKATRAAAITEGDVAAVDQADRAIAQLQELKPEEPPASAPASTAPPAPADAKGKDPVIEAWISENPWFRSNAALNETMIEEYGEIQREMPGLSQREQLDRAKKEVQKRFPEKFGENPRRREPSSVGSSARGGGGRPGNGRTFADVPKADQDAFKRHQKMMKEANPPIEYTEAEFLAGYNWG